MPTRTGIATAACAAIFLVGGRVFGIFEIYVVAAAMLALVACAWLWVLLHRRSLAVHREVNPARLHAGATSTVTLDLSNDRMLPTPVARITDEVEGAVRADAHVPPIRRRASTRASYQVPTEVRGLIDIGPMRTRIIDPFGLASSSRMAAPDATLLVLPRIDRIAPPPQPGGSIAPQIDRAPNRAGSSGDEFSSLRPYAIGDDLRKVHWRSSARTGDLVVRNELLPEHGHSLILLDVRSRSAAPDTFEHMVSAAASVAISCRDRGDDSRFVTTTGVDFLATNAAGYDTILDMLAVIEQSDDYAASLPFRVGDSGPQTGAVIVGDEADNLIASLQSNRSDGGGTCVVRFHGQGVKAKGAKARLTSTRMIDVHHDEAFDAAWTRAIGR